MAEPKSFVPDDEETDNTDNSANEPSKPGLLSKFVNSVLGRKEVKKPKEVKSFVPDAPPKEVPVALKPNRDPNSDAEMYLSGAKNTLSKLTDWSNPPAEKDQTPVKQEKKGFFKGVKDIGEATYEQVNKAGKSSFENIKKGDYPAALHDITSLAGDPFQGITESAIRATQGKRPIETSPEQAKEFALGALGIPGDRVLEAWRNKDYGRLAGQGLTAAATLALSHKFGEKFSPKETELISSRPKNEELPIRPPVREAVSQEGIHPSDLPPDLVPVGSEDIFNKNRGEDITNRTSDVFNKAKEKFNMGLEEPKSFTPDENPLSDYKPAERPLLRADASKMNPDQLQELNKFMDSVPETDLAAMQNEIKQVPQKMLPEGAKPTATYIGEQEGVGPLFNIEGGPKNKSTVTLEGLQKEGIDVPEYQKSNKSGAQLREEAIAARKVSNPFAKDEVKIPELVNNEAPPNAEEIDAYLSGNEPYKEATRGMISKSSPEEIMAAMKDSSAFSRNEPKSFTPDESLAKYEPKSFQPDEAKTPELVKPGEELKSSEERIASGEKVPDYNNVHENGAIWVDNLHGKGKGGYTTPANVRFIEDTARMAGERRAQNADPVFRAKQKAESDSWNKMQENIRIGDQIRTDIGDEAYHKMGDEEFQNLVEQYRNNPNSVTEMHGGIGGVGGGKTKYPPSTGPAATALDKLFTAMGGMKEKLVQQEMINKTERARRFAESASVTEEGRKGAVKSLGAMKGDFEKVDTDKLKLGRNEVDSLFTAVKRANITEGEKIRGYSALFKMLNGEGVPPRNELKLLDDVFGNGFAERILEMHGGIGAVGLKLAKTANTMKAMKSTLDLSAPLRQGIGLVHRPEYRQAFKEMFKYYADKEYYNERMKEIESDPNYLKARDAGLFLAKHNDITGSEEAFANNYIGNLPGIRIAVDASERAYTGFLNDLRFDTFKNLTKNAETAGNEVFAKRQIRDSKGNFVLDDAGNVKTVETPTKVADNIAKYINVSTGRGGLGRLEKVAPELNTVLWSPRLISSRLSVLNPKYYIDMDTFTRHEAIKSLFAIAATGTAVAGLAKLNGAKVGTDITSADFMKARMGNNVLDPWAGFQQPIVAAARMIKETHRMATGQKKDYNKPNLLEIPTNFMVNKLSPIASLAYEIGTARNYTGKTAPGDVTTLGMPQRGGFTDKYGNKKYLNTEALRGFMPMFIQDVTDVFKNDSSFGEQVGLDTASLFGMGVQNYTETGKNPKTFRKMSIR